VAASSAAVTTTTIRADLDNEPPEVLRRHYGTAADTIACP